MKIANKLLTIIALLIYCHSLAAYETSTHRELSIFAANASILSRDPTLLNDLGMVPYSSPAYIEINVRTGERVGTPQTAANIIGLGAVSEDDYGDYLLDYETKRPFRHFYDPQSGSGLRFLNIYWEPSPVWALETTPIEEQNFSYADARVHYSRVFSSSTPEVRTTEMSFVLQTLGQIIHHLQDMGC